ncbi:MAG: hypothetical protein QM703_13980 [Gemmatales bacterium]
MPKAKNQKMILATELWQVMPEAKLAEFVASFEKTHGMPISQPAAYLAKKQAGLTKTNKKTRKSTGTVTLEQLQSVYALAKQHSGIKEVRKLLGVIKPIVVAAGGYEQLERSLDMIEELKKK